MVRQAVRAFDRATSPGQLGLRAIHLASLIDADPGEGLIESLTAFITVMLEGRFPDSLIPFFGCANLLALPKKLEELRPIAVGALLRRLASKVSLLATEGQISASMDGHQLGAGVSLGSERIVHMARRALDAYPDLVFLQLDFENAFNSISRRAVLDAVAKYVPDILLYVAWLYKRATPLHVGAGLEPIPSEDGVQQGDLLGPLLFCLALRDMLAETAGGDDIMLLLAYLDDLALGGSAQSVRAALDVIEQWLPKLGLSLKMTKCTVYNLKTEDFHLFPVEFVHVTRDELVLLSVPLGSPAAVSAFLRQRLVEPLQELGPRLADLDDVHAACYIVKKCIAFARPVY